ATASLTPRQESSQPSADSQLSAMARLVGPSDSAVDRDDRDDEDERGQISSVMPTAAAAPSIVPQVEAPAAVIKTPMSMVPESEGPVISVAPLTSLPAVEHDSGPIPAAPSVPAAAPVPVATSLPPIATPAPLLIPLSPAPV